MFGRKSFATTAAGLLAVVALVAGCSSTPLTDARKILSNAKANFDGLKSVHFQLEAVGQFMFGYPVVTPAPTIEPTPVPTIEPSASAVASGSAAAPSGSCPASRLGRRRAAGGGQQASANANPNPNPPPPLRSHARRLLRL